MRREFIASETATSRWYKKLVAQISKTKEIMCLLRL